MPASRKTSTSKTGKTETPCGVFTETRDFISRFVALDDEQLDVCAMWVMGTWTFSPAAPAMPYTYPYLYVNGPSGSGKSTLGNKVFNKICRQPQPMAGATGPALFRTLITWDAEANEPINHWPTLLVDEIDATYNGAKDEVCGKCSTLATRREPTFPGRTAKSQ